MAQSIKTKEQILKHNLNKTLGRIKTQVADKEEFWLEVFQETLQSLIASYYDVSGTTNIKDVVSTAGNVADEALNVYEARWGK